MREDTEGLLMVLLAISKALLRTYVDVVHFILKELVHKYLNETQELKRFPTLQAEVATSANEYLERIVSKKSSWYHMQKRLHHDQNITMHNVYERHLKFLYWITCKATFL